MAATTAKYYFRFCICWCRCLQKVKVYQQTKFRRDISIGGWSITTSGFEIQTSAILEFYFRFRSRPVRHNLHAILHQAAEFRPNWSRRKVAYKWACPRIQWNPSTYIKVCCKAIHNYLRCPCWLRIYDLFIFTGRPAHSAAMPVLFLLSGPKMVFCPAINVEFGTNELCTFGTPPGEYVEHQVTRDVTSQVDGDTIYRCIFISLMKSKQNRSHLWIVIVQHQLHYIFFGECDSITVKVKSNHINYWRTDDAALKCTRLVAVEAFEWDEVKDAVHGVMCSDNTDVSVPATQYKHLPLQHLTSLTIHYIRCLVVGVGRYENITPALR